MCRLLVLEKSTGAYWDLSSVLYTYKRLLATTTAGAVIMLLLSAHLLHYAGHFSHDHIVRSQIGSIARSLWGAFLMMIGDFIWVDFS